MPRAGHGLLLLIATATIPSGLSQSAVSYSIRTLAGSDFVGDGGLATAALIRHLEGVAVDNKGNIYVADADDHRIRKIAPNGVISTVAGNGHAGFSGDGGPGASAELRTPYGIAADRLGNVYIADLGNARVRKVGSDGTITTVAGGGTEVAADGAVATAVSSVAPRNLATDATGAVYFTDFGAHRLYQVSSSGTLSVVAGTGKAGYAGDGGAARFSQLSAPAGVAVEPFGVVYVADTGNGRVRKIDRGVISTLGDGGRPGAPSAVPVTLPTGLALDFDGSLYVADPGGNQILRVTTGLSYIPVAQPARDVAVDAAGNLYACLDGLLYRRPRNGSSVVIAGGTTNSYLGDGGPASQARFARLAGVVRDTAGNVYVADTGNQRVRKIATDGTVTTVAGTGWRGFSGDGGVAVAAKLDTPVGLALDAAGNLFIADSGNHRIRKVDLAGFISTAVGTGVRSRSTDGTLAQYAQLDTPVWLAFDREGSLYFSEAGNHAVRKVNATGQIRTVAGNGARGYNGDGIPALAAALDSPQGIAVDASGNLYIADAGNRRVRMVTAASGIITTLPDANASTWRGVRGLAVDSQGSLYVTDADDARVFRIDLPGRVYTIAGTPVASFTGESGTALQVGIDAPAGIAVDGLGTVYFADSGNGRLRVLTPESGGTVIPQPALEAALVVVNAASMKAGPVAPGELVSLFGSGLGPAEGVAAAQPTVQLGGTQVTFNGRLAPMTFAGQGQVNLQVPYSVAEAKSCDVQVMVGGVVIANASVEVAAAAPGIFAVSGGTGQAAALNEDGSLNSKDNPAARGSVIVLFATGEGQTNPAGIEGRGAGWPAPVPVLPVSVRIGDYPAEILYAGEAPGFAGLLQVNARVPAGFAPPGVLQVTLQVGTAASPAGVTVAVR